MNQWCFPFRTIYLNGWLSLIFLVGCVSPVALHRAVLEYDWTVNRIETELLLLNIARMRYHEPIHFTVVSSIAATFDFRVTTGLTGVLTERSGFNSLSLTLGSSAAENPTVSIIPIQGEEFTKRLLTPISENTVRFLMHQGIEPAILLRLIARGMILEDDEGQRRLLLNQPHRKEEYREFRQRVMHLSWLQSERNLFIGTLQFSEGSEQKTGRTVITNYDPDMLSPQKRQNLHNHANRFPLNHILVDIQKGYPGGDLPFFGEIVLRSFKSVLGFIGRGITEDQEFHVDPDSRTQSVPVNPVKTLTIQESTIQPEEAIISVKKRGRWYYIEQQSQAGALEDRWNHEAFDILYQFYHLTVTDTSQSPAVPITISK